LAWVLVIERPIAVTQFCSVRQPGVAVGRL